jgi:tetratricopeptide (TPR) repeat protein
MVARRTVLLTRPALVAALLALGAGLARADDQRGDARAHYARGLALGSQNGYDGALREFNEAYAISPQFAVLYNIGQAHVALGHTAEAIEALEHYLRDGGDRISSARRLQVERQIAQLRSKMLNPEQPIAAEAERATAVAAGSAAGEAIAAASEESRAATARPGTLTVRCADPALRLSLDGKRIDLAASSKGIGLPGGIHHLVLSAPGRRSTDEALEIPEGGTALVICEILQPAAAAPVSPPRNPIEGPPVFSPVTAGAATPTVHAKTVGYLLGGLGLALGGTAVGIYLWNRGQNAKVNTEYGNLDPSTNGYYERAIQYDQDADAVRRNSQLTVGLAVASVGLLAGGVYLFFHERKRDEERGEAGGARSWAAVTPSGISLTGIW